MDQEQPINAEVTPRNIPYKINEIVSVDDYKFEIVRTYSQDYFNRNFEALSRKYAPTHQFIVHDQELIVVAKPIKEAQFRDIEDEEIYLTEENGN